MQKQVRTTEDECFDLHSQPCQTEVDKIIALAISAAKENKFIKTALNQIKLIKESKLKESDKQLHFLYYLSEISRTLGEKYLAFKLYTACIGKTEGIAHIYTLPNGLNISFNLLHRNCKRKQVLLVTQSSQFRGRSKHIDQAINIRNAYNTLFSTNRNDDDGETAANESSAEPGFWRIRKLLSDRECQNIINLANQNSNKQEKDQIIYQYFYSHGLLRSILNQIKQSPLKSHIAWRINHFSKASGDKTISDNWHYDQLYPYYVPKILVYLNEQSLNEGGTDFCSQEISRKITERTGYLGRVWERPMIKKICASIAHQKDLINDSIDFSPSQYLNFSPANAGDSICFYPSCCLHRGRSPKAGVRHVLSISLFPFPTEYCTDNKDQKIDTSDLSNRLITENFKVEMNSRDIPPIYI